MQELVYLSPVPADGQSEGDEATTSSWPARSRVPVRRPLEGQEDTHRQRSFLPLHVATARVGARREFHAWAVSSILLAH